MFRKPKRLIVSVILLLFASLALGVATSPASGPKYPLVTLEIPPIINEIEAPAAILASLQETVIEEFRKKNLFADVLPATDVIDGVLVIQGTVASWKTSEAMKPPGAGTLTVRLAIFQKIVTCPFNRATVEGVVSAEMLEAGSVASDHALVKGALNFLLAITGDQ